MRIDLSREPTDEDRAKAEEAAKKSVIELIQKTIIPYYHRMYKETQNPLFAWESFRRSQDFKLDVPEWVNHYLWGCADALSNLAETWVPGTTRAAGFISNALEMGNGRGVSPCFERYREAIEKDQVRGLIKNIERQVEMGKLPRADKIERAAKQIDGIGYERIRQIYYVKKR